MKCENKSDLLNLSITEKCCTGETGCEFDGTLRNVRAESIYTQKVYDAALFNLQALRTITEAPFKPALGPGARIIKVTDIRCKKFFNPENIDDPANLTVTPKSTISGASFVKDACSDPVEVVGPDGMFSEKIIYTDTQACDEKGKGTPVFGSQVVKISGNVTVEIDVIFTDNCDKRCKATLVGDIQIAPPKHPLSLTNFFELCIPSVFDTAFLPRFAEFCNLICEPRLATNSIMRDIDVDPITGTVKVNLIVALCITCEKKIIVPVQLCVLSTGFPVLQAETAPICTAFPTLFPEQIDEDKGHCCSTESELDTE
ncbi:hypothetical protein [Caldisalinibacter kiritimatiensis]|uniref:Uncharacterized protein n=1 Tax=Caldisalinibacter kiritimatiensis TaxID=1304284 RepID=R1AVA1_9FIRM|nr:hypothetical protein [Caldisalinibacter kiritimatiensis]EOD00572.1 hypothetical protein L21TH_1390 [Caldisalinibacter kiritimatiensis]